jgi:hypothetical protein
LEYEFPIAAVPGIPGAAAARENADEGVRAKLPRVSVEMLAPPALLKGALERKRACWGSLPAFPFQNLAISI